MTDAAPQTDTVTAADRPDATPHHGASDVDTRASAPGVDLVAIERDLDDVELALGRLANGAYWTDEVTGEPLPPELLAERPTARRVEPSVP